MPKKSRSEFLKGGSAFALLFAPRSHGSAPKAVDFGAVLLVSLFTGANLSHQSSLYNELSQQLHTEQAIPLIFYSDNIKYLARKRNIWPRLLHNY